MIAFMNIHRTLILAVALAATSAFAQAPTPATTTSPALSNTNPAVPTSSPPATATSPAMTTTTTAPAQPSADMQEMMKMMMEMGKVGENHKLLGELAGNWTYTIKMWMDPAGKPQESKGTSTRKAIMDGRYYIAEHTGKFQMPGADGKMKDMNFKGMAMEGYDNAKKKFVSSWIDNMSTMIMNSEGTYDAATKTFTYNAECEMMPGKMTKIREVIKVVDKDHHVFEWYDNSHGPEAKTMEIAYTRAGKK
jgi:flagellar basal body rod protein FlgC